MIRTRVCDLLGIEHPIFLGGLGGGHTSPEMVAAVSAAGGFGAQGCHMLGPRQVADAAAAIRARTDKPFALNFLLFLVEEDCYAAALAQKPAAIVIAWPRPDQDMKGYIARAHEAGCKVMVMAGGVPEARGAADAGADIVIAQGTEGGGHVGWMASMALVPMVVDAVAPVPVLAAGGIADGRGLAAALALGADGALLGTRFLAAMNRPFMPISSRRLWPATGTTRCFRKFPISRRARFGRVRCHAPRATPSCSVGRVANGLCANISARR